MALSNDWAVVLEGFFCFDFETDLDSLLMIVFHFTELYGDVGGDFSQIHLNLQALSAIIGSYAVPLVNEINQPYFRVILRNFFCDDFVVDLGRLQSSIHWFRVRHGLTHELAYVVHKMEVLLAYYSLKH